MFNYTSRKKTYLLTCAPNKDWSAGASAQFGQRLCCSHEKSLHPWLSKMLLVRILIRLRECAGWSESSLGAHVQRYVSAEFLLNFTRVLSGVNKAYYHTSVFLYKIIPEFSKAVIKKLLDTAACMSGEKIYFSSRLSTLSQFKIPWLFPDFALAW